MALWIPSDPDAPAEFRSPADGAKFTLKEMQAMVGGLIEPVILPNGLVMMCNEEGRLRGLPDNFVASVLTAMIICGDVFIGTRREVGENDGDGLEDMDPQGGTQ